MVDRLGAARKRRRKHAFSDEQVFRIITKLILDEGITGVSLPAIAKHLGYSHQALTYRYVNRAGMLEHYAAWVRQRTVEAQEAVIRASATPLAAFRAVMVAGAVGYLGEAEAATDSGLMTRLFVEMQRDPDVRPLMKHIEGSGRERLVAIVAESQRLGELTDRFAPIVIVDATAYAAFGAAAVHVGEPYPAMMQRIQSAVESTLRPFLPEVVGARP